MSQQKDVQNFCFAKRKWYQAYNTKRLYLDTAERLGCEKMKEDGKNSWLARNRGGGKVGRGREGSLTDSLSNTETKLHRLTESQ